MRLYIEESRRHQQNRKYSWRRSRRWWSSFAAFTWSGWFRAFDAAPSFPSSDRVFSWMPNVLATRRLTCWNQVRFERLPSASPSTKAEMVSSGSWVKCTELAKSTAKIFFFKIMKHLNFQKFSFPKGRIPTPRAGESVGLQALKRRSSIHQTIYLHQVNGNLRIG